MLVNLNDVLRDAQKKHYAVGLFNTTDTDMLEAAIFDAVGSECADLAIGLLQKLAAAELRRYGLYISQQRFSAGYGGVELFHQQEIFQQLELETLGIHLTETFIMQPEKSVTAFAFVNNGAMQ